jgi:hypothetical protein
MDIFQNHFSDWLILLGILGLSLYVMKTVGQERSSFKDDSYLVQFGSLSLTIPNWWTITGQDKSHLIFERTDTRYDWYARFEYFPDHQDLPLDKILENKLNLEKLEFDQDVVFETDSRVLFRDTDIQRHFQEVIRVEGKASQDVVERTYYDIYIMRGLEDQGYFIFESRSSILNGLVEGPYFEESLSELSFIHES